MVLVVKRILVILLLILITSFSAQAKEKVYWKDVTGDGVQEKIYEKSVGAGRMAYCELVVKQKTPNGWKDIFPKEFPPGVNDSSRGTPMKIVFSYQGGFAFRKFDVQYPGLQALIYYPAKFARKTYFKGYFFYFDEEKGKFVFYKKDITDRQYRVVYIDSKTGQRFDPRDKIIKEFQGKTRFSRAFEVARRYWKALKDCDQDTAYSFCQGKDARDYFDSFQYLRKELPEVLNYQMYSYYGEIETYGDEVLFTFPLVDKEWQGRIFITLTMHQDPTVKYILGTCY